MVLNFDTFWEWKIGDTSRNIQSTTKLLFCINKCKITYTQSLKLRFGDTLVETRDTQMCRGTMVENHWFNMWKSFQGRGRDISRALQKYVLLLIFFCLNLSHFPKFVQPKLFLHSWPVVNRHLNLWTTTIQKPTLWYRCFYCSLSIVQKYSNFV